MSFFRRLRHLGENNLALKLFALALATLLYFAVRPAKLSHRSASSPRGEGARAGLTLPHP